MFWITQKLELITDGENERDWKNTKKLGSLLGEEEDLKRRMQLAAAQFSKLKNP